MIELNTSTIITITTYEIERVQSVIDGLRATGVANQARIAELEAEVAQLQASKALLQEQLDECRAGHEPPPPPPSPTDRLTVVGRHMVGVDGRLAGGGIESILGNTGLAEPETFFGKQAELGADILSPLTQGRWATLGLDLETHRYYCQAIHNLGKKHGYNVDNLLQDGIGMPGREWLKLPAVVEMCNSFPNMFIECEVETGWGQTATTWRDSVIAMVLELRAAGHLNVIKVGSPDGGRSPLFAVQLGHEVLAADPLRRVVFSWQAYWGLGPNSSGWSYQLVNGVSQNLQGTLDMAQRIYDSGLCFLVGVEAYDDIGPTGWETLIPKLNQLGIAWQWWVWQNPGNYNDPTQLTTYPLGTQLLEIADQVAALFPVV